MDTPLIPFAGNSLTDQFVQEYAFGKVRKTRKSKRLQQAGAPRPISGAGLAMSFGADGQAHLYAYGRRRRRGGRRRRYGRGRRKC